MRGAEAPGEEGTAACGHRRTAASDCHRSHGLCNAPQALTPALGGLARPGNPEREREREQRGRKRARETLNK